MNNQTAQIFYHVKEVNKQKIVVDADQVEGKILFPELELKEMIIKDIRNAGDAPSFHKDSFEFFHYETQVKSFENDAFKEIYNTELEKLLRNKIKAKEVIIFDHTIREDKSSARPPARHAHIDYSNKSAQEQINKYVDKEEREKWLGGHYALVNTWRPIENKVESAPLGFVLPHSVSAEELIEIDLVYPQRRGEVLGALFNKDHEWIYLNEMTPDEIVLFNMYDNQGRRPVIHSAFDFEDTKIGLIRKSIESRMLIRF